MALGFWLGETGAPQTGIHPQTPESWGYQEAPGFVGSLLFGPVPYSLFLVWKKTSVLGAYNLFLFRLSKLPSLTLLLPCCGLILK